MNFVGNSLRKVSNDILSIVTSYMTSVWPTFMMSTLISVHIHWYKNTGLGDELAIELTSLELNQTYPLDYSEYIHLLMMFELYSFWIYSVKLLDQIP